MSYIMQYKVPAATGSLLYHTLDDAKKAMDAFTAKNPLDPKPVIYSQGVIYTEWLPLVLESPDSPNAAPAPTPRPRKRIIRSALRHFRKD